MFDLLGQRLDHGARLTLPFITALFCTLLTVVTWPLPYFGSVAPPFALVTIYYWAIHRPDLFRPWLVFIIGLLNDVINFLPLGLSALLFVGIYQLTLSQRRFFAGHSFFMMWSGFALMAFVIMILEWLLLCLLRWQGLPFLPLLVQTILVVALFPLPCWLLIRLQRLTLSPN